MDYLVCNDCGAYGKDALFWERLYVRVDIAVNGAGLDRGDVEEMIDWDSVTFCDDKYECSCGSLNVEWKQNNNLQEV